ncbi:hypothetical protein A9K75_09240 [Campylobacter fetus subsp. testudinum]|uniref:hypothetical protein n=1 Tax=Campylobacter fetus TaxID=196 RepID=UPI0008188E7A|nr:hypothetical protein [Campylobacter fetus]OCR98928.1 hypothetical protein A9K75_09240 [Campylobacter fetus subsp. testudinum]
MSKLADFSKKCSKEEFVLIAKMLLEEDVDTVFEREKRELQGYDLKDVLKYVVNILKGSNHCIKYRANRAYYDKESREIRIPTSEIFPTCPTLHGADLQIKISFSFQDIQDLVLKSQDKRQSLHCCEFQWHTLPF